jgi:hypothetical protein
MGWMAKELEINSQQEQYIFLFFTASRLALAPTQSPIKWVLGALSQKVKQPGHEADHSPPFSAKVKNVWSYNSTLPYIFTTWCSLIKHFNYTESKVPSFCSHDDNGTVLTPALSLNTSVALHETESFYRS